MMLIDLLLVILSFRVSLSVTSRWGRVISCCNRHSWSWLCVASFQRRERGLVYVKKNIPVIVPHSFTKYHEVLHGLIILTVECLGWTDDASGNIWYFYCISIRVAGVVAGVGRWSCNSSLLRHVGYCWLLTMSAWLLMKDEKRVMSNESKWGPEPYDRQTWTSVAVPLRLSEWHKFFCATDIIGSWAGNKVRNLDIRTPFGQALRGNNKSCPIDTTSGAVGNFSQVSQ